MPPGHAKSKGDRYVGWWHSVLTQGAVVGAVSALIVLVIITTVANLQSREIPVGFSFLGDRAGFHIAESFFPYGPGDSNLWAITVGLGNTIFVSTIVIFISTLLGTLLGIARSGNNPLVSFIAKSLVESVRNVPPILLLILFYGVWIRALPPTGTVKLASGVLLSIRGLAFPELTVSRELSVGTIFAAVVLGLCYFISKRSRSPSKLRSHRAVNLRLGSILVLATWLSALIVWRKGIHIYWPTADGLDLVGGAQLSPELATLCIGLSLYAAAFVAEIVRSGIQSVSNGQWESAQALGLKRNHTLRLVVLPQMLRVIIPPLTSQHINTIKNSTLAIAVGYSDFMMVMGTVINKSSHAIEGTGLIIAVYLLINLGLSGLLGVFNARFALKGR